MYILEIYLRFRITLYLSIFNVDKALDENLRVKSSSKTTSSINLHLVHCAFFISLAMRRSLRFFVASGPDSVSKRWSHHRKLLE